MTTKNIFLGRAPPSAFFLQLPTYQHTGLLECTRRAGMREASADFVRHQIHQIITFLKKEFGKNEQTFSKHSPHILLKSCSRQYPPTIHFLIPYITDPRAIWLYILSKAAEGRFCRHHTNSGSLEKLVLK